ncbi:helix-turn-helix domain-containing protein [Rhodococcus jostii]
MDTAEIRSKLGAELRAARARRGYSQEKLAALSGISRNAIVRFESGERSIDVVRLFALAEALRVNPGDLLDAAQRGD